MTYRGHVKNGQILLNEPARLPEGAQVNVEVLETRGENPQSQQQRRVRRSEPVEMPGGSLADELIRDRS